MVNADILILQRNDLTLPFKMYVKDQPRNTIVNMSLEKIYFRLQMNITKVAQLDNLNKIIAEIMVFFFTT